MEINARTSSAAATTRLRGFFLPPSRPADEVSVSRKPSTTIDGIGAKPGLVGPLFAQDFVDALDVLRRALDAVAGLLLEAVANQSFDGLRNIEIGRRFFKTGDGSRNVHPQKAADVVGIEGRHPCNHLVHHDRERIEVGPPIDGLRVRLLGRDVCGRADGDAMLGELRIVAQRARVVVLIGAVVVQLGDAEVEDLGEVRVLVVLD